MKTEINYHGYKISYYLFPGKNLNKFELLDLHQNILDMNIESGRNFKYGIFDHEKPFSFKKEFYDQIMMVTIHDSEGNNAGFFYNYIMPVTNEYLVHQGLVVIFKNTGVDLLKDPYLFSNILIFDYLKQDYFTSNISAVPLIVGVFSDIFESVWPSIYSNDCRFAPKNYQELARNLYDNYIQRFFPDGTIFDRRRFVLKSPLKEMGFGLNIKELPRHPNWQHNVFSHYWLDLNQGEDLVQVGKMTKRMYDQHTTYLKSIKFINQENKNEKPDV